MPRGLSYVCLALLGTGCLSPTRPTARTPFEVGRDAAQAGDYRTAAAQLSLALETAQSFFFTQAYLERGECYIHLARSAETPADRERYLNAAQSDFEAVVQEPSTTPRDKAQALYSLGTVFLSREDAGKAEEVSRRILELPLGADEQRYRLAAHRRIGWLHLERLEREAESRSAAASTAELQEAFRLAQEQFSRCLEIDPNDEDALLGKGLCLYFRGQYREAIRCLERSVRRSRALGLPNPRGHYYLGRALEFEKGLQETALEQYAAALEQDTSKRFTALYVHLVKALPIYLPLEDPRAWWFLDRMLQYAGDSSAYWEAVEALACKLAGSSGEPEPGSSEHAELRRRGILARAIARARNRKVSQAIADSLLLAPNPEFLSVLARIFPDDPPVPEYLYGKACVLLGARQYEELEKFYQSKFLQSPTSDLAENPYYHKTLMLEGRAILSRWLSENRKADVAISPETKLERDRILGKARDAFQRYLERYPDDAEARRSLGTVQELMEAYASAFLNYAVLARHSEDDTEVFERICELHRKKLLSAPDMLEAWNLLRKYAGTSAMVKEYVERTREAIRAERLLYCTVCGRKADPGDRLCLECGHEIREASQPPPEAGN